MLALKYMWVQCGHNYNTSIRSTVWPKKKMKHGNYSKEINVFRLVSYSNFTKFQIFFLLTYIYLVNKGYYCYGQLCAIQRHKIGKTNLKKKRKNILVLQKPGLCIK